jgi:hypothetical protein
MAGSMKNSNKFPTVVTTPTGRVGGTNKEVTVSTNPTKYTGGFNKAACDVPTGKLKK